MLDGVRVKYIHAFTASVMNVSRSERTAVPQTQDRRGSSVRRQLLLTVQRSGRVTVARGRYNYARSIGSRVITA